MNNSIKNLLLFTNKLSTNDNFVLLQNGVTIINTEGPIGDTGFIEGKTYTKRTVDQITDQNAATTCTTGITDLGQVFKNYLLFNDDISHWDTSQVTSIRGLFEGQWNQKHSFNQDISYWDTSNLVKMNFSFLEAEDFNQDISNWEVSNVSDFRHAFRNAESFNQNLGYWDIKSVTTMDRMLENSGLSTENYSKTLIGWANRIKSYNNLPSGILLGAGSLYYNGLTYTDTFGTGETGAFVDAISAREYLSLTAGWVISDEGLSS